MQIDYGKIVTNALSALVAAVFVGAAAIVWQAATSIDERIEAANDDLLQQQAAIKATQETIVPELTGMKETVQDLKAEIRRLNKLLADSKMLSDTENLKIGEPVFSKKKDPARSQQEIDRITNKIDTRQMEIYQQRTPLK